MKIELTSFRYHDHLVVELRDSRIYLLQGNSGVGKSTLFEAIAWALFGKVTKIAPLVEVIGEGETEKKCRTSVSLQVPGLSILRQNNPRVLKVSKNGVQYEDVAAQGVIIESFGEYDFWVATSYLRQKSFNPLMFGSSSEKLELINRLAFQNEDPTQYIERVEKRLKEVSTETITLSSDFNTKLQILRSNMNRYGVVDQDLVSPPMIVFAGRYLQVEDARSECSRLRGELDKARANALMVQQLQAQIAQLSSQIGEQTLESLETRLRQLELEKERASSYESYLSKKRYLAGMQQQRDALRYRVQTEFVGLEEVIPPCAAWNSQTMSQAVTHANNYERNRKLALDLGIEYSNDVIQKELQALREQYNQQLELLKQVEVRSRRKEFLRRIAETKQRILQQEEALSKLVSDRDLALKEIPSNPTTEHNACIEEQRQLSFKTQRESYLEHMLNVPPLSCPHCSGAVRYLSSQLVKIEDYNVEALKAELQGIQDAKKLKLHELSAQQQKYYLEMQDFQRRNNQLSSLNIGISSSEKEVCRLTSELKNLEHTCPPLSEASNDGVEEDVYQISTRVSSISTRGNNLKQICVMEPPTKTYQEMERENRALLRAEVLRNLEKLESQVTELEKEVLSANFEETSPPLTMQKIFSERQYLEQVKSQLLHRDMISKELEKADKTAGDPLVLSLEIGDLSSRIEKALRIQEIIRDRDSMIPLHNAYISKQTQSNHVANLQQIMIDSEYSAYALVAKKINAFLEQVIGLLFEESISVKLQMFKSLRSKDRIKPMVNLSVIHRDCEIDVRNLSGGEKDRLSMALTLALMNMSTSPLILIDETFASLGSAEDQERATSILPRYGKEEGKTIICVNPGGPSGWFDDVIKLPKKTSPT